MEEDYKECKMCGCLFDEEDINEYGYCEGCQYFIDKENQELRETYESLYKSER